MLQTQGLHFHCSVYLRQRSQKAQAESRGGAISKPPKVKQVVDPRDGLVGHKAVLKTDMSHLARGRADETVAAIGQCSCHLGKTTTLTILHKLAE
jgi:hypothetical protein